MRRGRKVGLVCAALALAAIVAGILHRKELQALLTGEVEVRIETVPPNARLFLDGAELLSNPLQLRRSSQRFSLRVEAPFHRPRTLTILPDLSRTYRVVLEPLPAPLPRRTGRGPAVRSPRPIRERCPRGMQLIPSDPPACIDRYEHPGRGQLPSHGVTLAEARRRCHARGARLCAAEEWLRACCRRFPYGDRYQPERCRTGGGELAPSGSKPGCRSSLGVYDLSGNVSEWVEDGLTLGGDASGADDAVSCAASTDGVTAMTGFRCCADPPWD